eukprot:CFRG5708T1
MQHTRNSSSAFIMPRWLANPFSSLCCGYCPGIGLRQEHDYEPVLFDSDEAEAVQYLLQHIEGPPELLVTGRSVGALKLLSYSNNVDVQRSAALTYAEASSGSDVYLTEDILQPILVLARSTDSGVLRAISGCLSNVTNVPSNASLLIVAGFLDIMTRLLTSENLDVQCNACACVEHLAAIDAIGLQIAKAGSLDSLVRLAGSDVLKVQKSAADALAILVEKNKLLVQHLLCLPIIPTYVSLLQSGDSHLRHCGAVGLNQLTNDESGKRALIQFDLKENVVQQLAKMIEPSLKGTQSTPTTTFLLRSLVQLTKASSSVRCSLVQAGGLDHLLPIVSKSTDIVVVADLLTVVSNLSIERDNNTETGLLKSEYALLYTMTAVLMWTLKVKLDGVNGIPTNRDVTDDERFQREALSFSTGLPEFIMNIPVRKRSNFQSASLRNTTNTNINADTAANVNDTSAYIRNNSVTPTDTTVYPSHLSTHFTTPTVVAISCTFTREGEMDSLCNPALTSQTYSTRSEMERIQASVCATVRNLLEDRLLRDCVLPHWGGVREWGVGGDVGPVLVLIILNIVYYTRGSPSLGTGEQKGSWDNFNRDVVSEALGVLGIMCLHPPVRSVVCGGFEGHFLISLVQLTQSEHIKVSTASALVLCVLLSQGNANNKQSSREYDGKSVGEEYLHWLLENGLMSFLSSFLSSDSVKKRRLAILVVYYLSLKDKDTKRELMSSGVYAQVRELQRLHHMAVPDCKKLVDSIAINVLRTTHDNNKHDIIEPTNTSSCNSTNTDVPTSTISRRMPSTDPDDDAYSIYIGKHRQVNGENMKESLAQSIFESMLFRTSPSHAACTTNKSEYSSDDPTLEGSISPVSHDYISCCHENGNESESDGGCESDSEIVSDTEEDSVYETMSARTGRNVATVDRLVGHSSGSQYTASQPEVVSMPPTLAHSLTQPRRTQSRRNAPSNTSSSVRLELDTF